MAGLAGALSLPQACHSCCFVHQKSRSPHGHCVGDAEQAEKEQARWMMKVAIRAMCSLSLHRVATIRSHHAKVA